MCAELLSLGAFWLLVLSPWIYSWICEMVELYNEGEQNDEQV